MLKSRESKLVKTEADVSLINPQARFCLKRSRKKHSANLSPSSIYLELHGRDLVVHLIMQRILEKFLESSQNNKDRYRRTSALQNTLSVT